jgi:hypothetical protein
MDLAGSESKEGASEEDKHHTILEGPYTVIVVLHDSIKSP